MGGPPLEFINIQPLKRGSASKFHQLDGGPPLEFINIQPPKRWSASRIHQHTATKRGSASRIHQHPVCLKGQFLWIQRYLNNIYSSTYVLFFSFMQDTNKQRPSLPIITFFLFQNFPIVKSYNVRGKFSYQYMECPRGSRPEIVM